MSRLYKSISSLYNCWNHMHQRCNNSTDAAYASYGGRGITVCSEWESFTQFKKDVGLCPIGHSLDRKDNDGNYCKDNCRWATPSQQNFNRNEFSAQTRVQPNKNSSTGVLGVNHIRHNTAYMVTRMVQGHKYILYTGKDFFEACCAAKSFENSSQKLN